MKIVITKKEIKSIELVKESLNSLYSALGVPSLKNSSKWELLKNAGIIHRDKMISIRISLKGDLKIEINEDFMVDYMKAYSKLVNVVTPSIVTMITTIKVLVETMGKQTSIIEAEFAEKWFSPDEEKLNEEDVADIKDSLGDLFKNIHRDMEDQCEKCKAEKKEIEESEEYAEMVSDVQESDATISMDTVMKMDKEKQVRIIKIYLVMLSNGIFTDELEIGKIKTLAGIL